MNAPGPQGLYDPRYEHDSCGVAFVVDVAGRRSHEVIARGMAALCRLDHRGARGSEPNTGDGAGISIGIPDEFLRAVVDFELPPTGAYATGIVFLPNDEAKAAKAVEVLEKYALVEGATILGWRDVPTDPVGLGESALAVMPRIRQVFLVAHPLSGGEGPLEGLALERVAYCVRKQAERETRERGLDVVLLVAVRPHHRLQRNVDAGPGGDVLPGAFRRAGRQRHRVGAFSLLHQYLPLLAAGASRTATSPTMERSTLSGATATGWPPARPC